MKHAMQSFKCLGKLYRFFLKPTVSFCVLAVAQAHAIFVKVLLYPVVISFHYYKDDFSLCALTVPVPVGVSCSRGAKGHH